MKSRMHLVASFLLLNAALALTACVNVKKSDNGDNVDVKTPFGSVSVRTDEVKPEETGLSVYPGSKLVPKHGHDHDQANVNIAFFFSSRRRHTRLQGDWSSDVCSSD